MGEDCRKRCESANGMRWWEALANGRWRAKLGVVARPDQPRDADHSRGADRAPHVVSVVSGIDHETERDSGSGDLD